MYNHKHTIPCMLVTFGIWRGVRLGHWLVMCDEYKVCHCSSLVESLRESLSSS